LFKMKKGNPSQRQVQDQIKRWRQEPEKPRARSRAANKIPKDRETGQRKNEADAERAASELKTETALPGKDARIKEIQHRFINHLNLIYNILYFQKQYGKDEHCNAVLESIQKRIRSIAMVYEHVQRSLDLDQVRFDEYLRSLLKESMQAAAGMKKKIALKTRIDNVAMDLTTAITCGLIVNELLGNCLKHAFPDQRRAEIFFGLQDQKDGTVELTVSDNGVGLPPGVQWRSSSSMGSFLVNTLSENIKGELTVNGDNGTAFHLRFSPLSR
jgi:two-component sensor histidine kinase